MVNMHYVYLLKSTKQNWTYIGCTDNLERRFTQHQRGEVRSTAFYTPLKLVYYEAYSSKTDARSREIKLKKHSQTKELLLNQLSNSLNEASSSNG